MNVKDVRRAQLGMVAQEGDLSPEWIRGRWQDHVRRFDDRNAPGHHARRMPQSGLRIREISSDVGHVADVQDSHLAHGPYVGPMKIPSEAAALAAIA